MGCFLRKIIIAFYGILLLPAFIIASPKEIFFKNLERWEIAKDLGHPRLYFNAKSIKELQAQYHSGNPCIRSFLSDCDSLISRPVPDFSDYNLSRYKARGSSERLSFAYAITENTKYANYARAVIKQMIIWTDWVYEEHKPLRVDLGVAGAAYVLAMCYDWLYPVLTVAERSAIEEAILEKALIPFHDIYQTKSERWTKVEHNWRSVICGEMGIATLALLERVPKAKENLTFAIDGVVDVLNHGGEDGGWNEGVSYWGFGVGQAVMFVEALYQVSGGLVDLYDLPFLKVTGNFGLYTRTPAGDSFNFSDCNPGPPKPWMMALLASHYNNPYWQWNIEKDLENNIPDILFYHSNLPVEKPKDLVLGKHFKGIQVATMRSSWDDHAIFIGLKTGQTVANHSHLDLNSFILHAHGKPLLIDQYNWPYAHYLGYFDNENKRWDFEGNHTIAHNTLLVDGQGQVYGEKSEGKIIKFSTSSQLQFAVGEANTAYGDLLSKFHRYMALVDSQVVIIVDDVSAREIRKLEWLMHYTGEASEDSSGVFRIANGEARLDIQFLRPSKEENRVISFENHETSYKATREITTQNNRFISIRPLHRQKDYRFIAIAFPYRSDKSSVYSTKVLLESEKHLKLEVIVNHTVYRLVIDFMSQNVSLVK
jgi:hypothetical protein